MPSAEAPEHAAEPCPLPRGAAGLKGTTQTLESCTHTCCQDSLRALGQAGVSVPLGLELCPRSEPLCFGAEFPDRKGCSQIDPIGHSKIAGQDPVSEQKLSPAAGTCLNFPSVQWVCIIQSSKAFGKI